MKNIGLRKIKIFHILIRLVFLAADIKGCISDDGVPAIERFKKNMDKNLQLQLSFFSA
jgi:hypothetical protein